MNVVRYDPWQILNETRNELDRLFGRMPNFTNEGDQSKVTTSHWTPAVDIREETDKYVLQADLPGVDPNDIEITMENGMLTIKGERKLETQENHEGYTRLERVRGIFHRRFSLPETANLEKISARSNNGVLEICIPKQEKVQPRRISIESIQ
jgi:HSP20 family protein